jgi:hypothetical protein
MNGHRPTAAVETAVISIALVASGVALTPTRSADINPYAAGADVNALRQRGRRRRGG